MNMNWTGVIPAITTPFHEDLTIDFDAFAVHCRWMIDSGCTGVVALGSLGEGGSQTLEEKHQLLATAVKAIGGRAPVVAGVAALTTADAVKIAQAAHAEGCSGLMVLPPYVYVGDWRETKAHVAAILEATPLSCMLYNNPIAYKTDFLPEQVVELLIEHDNLHAIKESSADVRRVSSLRALVPERLQILVGVDDLIFEGIAAGAVGWIAGLVNAFPQESVDLFNLARAGKFDEAFEIYRWFLPLLRLDTVPKFVQLIKFSQQVVGRGSERVRPPRLPIAGAERDETLAMIEKAIAHHPYKKATA